jgi:streptogramin lyase
MPHLRLRALGVVSLSIITGVPAMAQKIVEFTIPTSASSPTQIVAGPDGRLWFCENVGNNVGAITTAGTIDEYPIPTAAGGCQGIASVTYATGGALFYSESKSGKLGAMDTTGTTIDTHLAESVQDGLADGHDGRLWLATGSATVYADPVVPNGLPAASYPLTGGSSSTSLAFGPDGRMWVTDFGGSNIFACKRDSVTCDKYSLGDSEPQAIVAGTDGNLYFTDSLNNWIRQIKPDGTLGPFRSVPTPSSRPDSIVTDAAGNLWFTESAGNKIGRMTTAGVFTEYTVPTGFSEPSGIAVGPDGNIWFTEGIGNKIGKLFVSIPGDVDDSGHVDVADVFYLINFLFAGGPAPR